MTDEFDYNGMYCKKWLCENETAVIQIIHGLGEMSEYYEQFADYFTAHGISVYLAELHYHGRTKLDVKQDNLLHIMAQENVRFSAFIKARHNDKPLILLGHSMGADIAQLMMKDFCYDKVVLTGCAYFSNPDGLLADLDEEILSRGADAPCIDVFTKIFGRVAERFPEKCSVSWVTSDIERALYYEKLPYTNVMYSCRFYRSFLAAAKQIQDARFPLSLPYKPEIFMGCGNMDSVGRYGEYPPEIAENYRKAGFLVTLKIYDGMRHSVLQERDRLTVYGDILSFIDSTDK